MSEMVYDNQKVYLQLKYQIHYTHTDPPRKYKFCTINKKYRISTLTFPLLDSLKEIEFLGALAGASYITATYTGTVSSTSDTQED